MADHLVRPSLKCWTGGQTTGPTDGGVVDVVVGSDHAQIERSHIHLVLYADALGLLQVVQRGFHQLGQVVRQVTMGHS